MAEHIDLGKRGEQIAKEYLQKKGYKILKSNYRVGNAEVDLIAEYKRQTIFIEVKTRMQSKFGTPELAVTEEKRRNMKKVARGYIQHNKLQGEVRFDIISITFSNKNDYELMHFDDAFFLR
jgi:putative endonuclease